MNRQIRNFFVMVLFSIIALHGSASAQQLEFVQSIPMETDLGNKHFRNTTEVWLEMIKGAKKTIDVEVFYICSKPGQPLEKITTAIEEAAGRGVKIRIIIDSKFFKKYPEPATSLGKLPNVSVRVIDFAPVAGGIMHAKFFVVDRKSVFMGSQNFDWRALNQIHEMGVKINSPQIAREFDRIFSLDWHICKEPDGEYRGISKSMTGKVNRNHPVTLLYRGSKCTLYPAFSPPGLTYGGQETELSQILHLLKNAKKQVSIQVMTYSPVKFNKKGKPWMTLDNAIKAAADRGVKVRLIVSSWSVGNSKLPYLKSLDAHKNIQVRVSRVPRHSSGYIPFARVEHCKFMVVDDDLCWVGTGNWQYGYFFTSRNAAVVIKGIKPAADLAEGFKKSWTAPFVKPISKLKRK